LCFFFQAEDGIRGLIVTGVQTCALPICKRLLDASRAICFHSPPMSLLLGPRILLLGTAGLLFFSFLSSGKAEANPDFRPGLVGKIGRASCRERGARSVGGGARQMTTPRT